MQVRGVQIVYLVLLPVIVIAAGGLGLYSWRTASKYAQLNQETIGESTLRAVRRNVDTIENEIIQADNRVFALVDAEDPKLIERDWPPVAREISPSVRAVVALDADRRRVAFHVRGSEEDKTTFWQHFKHGLLEKLVLEDLAPGKLRHLHESVSGTTYLLSYTAVDGPNGRYTVILQHDVGHLLRERFQPIFDEDNQVYNVLDEQTGQRVFGANLGNSGVFVVGRRFPTTLYRWRLQAAPSQAPQLEQQTRTRQLNEVALVAAAIIAIILGIIVIVFAVDRERRFNAQQAEFIANVSHELKTPLSVVRMFSEMLVTGRVRDEAKQRQYLELIASESERLGALIENVLDFAALESGRRQYRKTTVDLAATVERVLATFRARGEHVAPEITANPPLVPTPALADEQAITLALMNLVDNAIKYAGNSPIVVSLTSTADRLEFRVRDHGPGIPFEDHRRIFERFYRSRNREGTRGSGIGLALVKSIAEAHGGRAWATNAPDGGAVVAFSIARGKVAGA